MISRTRHGILVLCACVTLGACASGPRGMRDGSHFDAAARAALQVMRSRAEQLHIGGVAVVAYVPGEHLDSWVSRMEVVGRSTDPAKGGEPGNNLLAIVYSKAAEMARTHQDSGIQTGPPMTGEVGWPGGVIARARHGFFIAAFSGGEDPDDIQVARAGLARLSLGIQTTKPL